MSYDIKIDLIPGLPQRPYRNGVGAYEGIVVHDTECPGDSDEMEVKYFKENWQTRQAFVHYFCDFDSISQTAKAEYQAWGAGNGNPRYLHIEMITASTQQAFDEVYKRTCWLAASKLFERKLDVIDGKTLVSHDWVTKNLGGTTHTDPIVYLKKWGKTWADIVKDVKVAYDALAKPITPTPTPPVTQPKVDVKYNTLTQERMFNTDIFSYKFKQSDVTLKYVVEAGLTVSQIRKKYNADLAINANYITGNSNIGNSKIGDKIISTGFGKTLKWNSFGYRNDNVEIGTLNFQDKWDFIVQSSPMIIDGGKSVYEASIKNDQTNPDVAAKDATPQRTFVIIDKSGDISFVIADGRPPANSRGLTIDNICEFAKSRNAQQCFNFDGGSSTSMCSKDKGSIGQNAGAHETAVHHALLVFVKNNNGGGNVDTSKFTPVHVDLVDSTHNAMNSIDGILIDNQTYVKLSDIAGFYGSKVDWDDINKSASLVK